MHEGLCEATAFVIMSQCAHWCDNLKAVDCVEIAASLTLLAMTVEVGFVRIGGRCHYEGEARDNLCRRLRLPRGFCPSQ